ncbi:MAG: DUF4835 family protein [Flammeovirgaceae bacterium]
MMRSLFVLLVCMLGATSVRAQELNCIVKVNGEQVQTQEQQVFTDMENAIQQFMNTQKWTDLELEDHEKIQCDILITLDKGNSITNFGASVQIKSMRPIYGTEYESPLLSFFDSKWRFSYSPAEPLIFAENTYTTELTSLLAYYAYIVIALDFDSFSQKGGNPYLERALNILNNSSASGGEGWAGVGGDTRDRYWLVTNLNSPQFDDYRLGIYEYHRLAMDTFTEDPDAARNQVIGVLQRMKRVRDQEPTSVTLNNFFDAKALELANIFSRSDEAMKQQAVDLLIGLDPTNASTYRKILK